MSDELLHFALTYLDRGWPVIPVFGKTPAISWRAYQERRPSVEEARAWFAADNGHDYNLAVVTGSVSRLVVVDCDTVEDATWWRESHPRTPLLVRTGRGGAHFYYRYPETEVRNRAGILGRKIDVRGEGGLVVAPPSVHPDTGRAYEWTPWEDYGLEGIPVFDAHWIPPAARTAARLGGAYVCELSPSIGDGVHDIFGAVV